MKEHVMSDTFSYLLQHIRDKKGLTPGILYDVSKLAAEVIRNHLYSRLDDNYYVLMEHVEKYQNFQANQGEETSYSFSMGELSGIVKLLEEVQKQEESASKISSDLNRYQEKKNIFTVVNEEPGITHKQLARRCGMEISNLSHLMSPMESDGYFYSRKSGRNKYYFLSGKGRELLEKMSGSEEDEFTISNEEDTSVFDWFKRSPIVGNADDLLFGVEKINGHDEYHMYSREKKKTMATLMDFSNEENCATMEVLNEA